MTLVAALLASGALSCCTPIMREPAVRKPELDPFRRDDCRREAERDAVLSGSRTKESSARIYNEAFNRCMRRGG